MGSEGKMYDLVVFGATGFTGQFVVEEVGKTIEGEGLSWAIAGRSMKKCETVLNKAADNIGKSLENVPIVMADVNSGESLLEMCRMARVVLNCVGPYRFYGNEVVKACIQEGAHHLDISGEPGFLEKMQLLHKDKAADQKVYIIGACGFDSIPADMGVIFTKNKFDGDLNEVLGYLTISSGEKGGAGNYATWQSAVQGFGAIEETLNTRKMLYSNPAPKHQHRQAKTKSVGYQEQVQRYCVTFPGSDRSVVKRTQRNVYERSKLRPVQFDALLTLPNLMSTILLVAVGTVFGLLAKFSFGRYLLETFPRFFSLGMFKEGGPTREQIKDGKMEYLFVGHGYPSKTTDPDEKHDDEPKKEIITKVTGPECGYVTTPICLVQAAYTLLKETDSLPESGGVMTPGEAFANTSLIQRLNKHGVEFSVVKE